MNISDESRQNLNEIRKWAYFLAILGFVGIGFLVIASLSIGTILNQLGDNNLPFPSSMFGGIYFVIAVLYFFPIYYLYKFSTNMKEALLNDDEDSGSIAFRNLKSHYKFIGIFTIVMMSIYLLAGVGFALVAVMFN
jgi:hypothetical protein